MFIRAATLIASLLCLRAVAGADTDVSSKAYRLAPRDVIEVKVYRQSDLDTHASISENGALTMPLLGSVPIAGKTPEEARDTIRERLAKDYLVDPQVSLTVVEYAKRLFTVMGEVQRPGTYEIPHDQSVNVLQAIAMAGGFTRLGAASKVVVHRIEGSEKKVYHIDAGAMAQNEKLDPFPIIPGDTITVLERMF